MKKGENFINPNNINVNELLDIISESLKLKDLDIKRTNAGIIVGDYLIKYEKSSKVVDLINKNGEQVSSWMLSLDNYIPDYLDLISRDFLNIILNVKPEANKISRKIFQSSSEKDINLVFFINRMITIFPELKENLTKMKLKESENFYLIEFIEKGFLPKIKELFFNEKDNHSEIEKLFKTFNNIYSEGNLDTRSVITMLILNNLSEKNINFSSKFMSKELKKAQKAALKYKI
ncbi:MAG: hypothetical protein RsTaC01_0061 [Candidatus Paraimprobicoccus trichonymphae]|uniref:DUF7674 domain-containing protein n=1 Tax=Candidatus Paraimprobicoccus trichonymphae TaxID=3033793 RepID=A0AA48I944_9FIRM|nr:MAG: hypothetical protein RsTaC01_0061 [Candidatus Paraimprobicoccus trichonymphae]